MNIGWQFQRNEDGSSKGGTIPLSRNLSLIVWRILTRETIQNSLDAKLDEIRQFTWTSWRATFQAIRFQILML